MKEKTGEVFSIANDNIPVAGCKKFPLAGGG